MELSSAERRIMDGVRRSERWRKVNVWAIALCVAALLTAAALLTNTLAEYLRVHHFALSDLDTVISESRHPSGVNLQLICVSVVMIAMTTLVGISTAMDLLLTKGGAARNKLLLKLAAQLEASRDRVA